MGQATRSARIFRATLDDVVRGKLGAIARRAPALGDGQRLGLYRVPIGGEKLGGLTEILDRDLWPHLKRMAAPIPADIIRDLKTNYTERLPKTMRVRTAQLSGRKTNAWKAAQALGIIDVLQSEALRRFGEAMTGQRLLPAPGCQIICYEPGDFSGPHTDHHPEDRDYRDGFVDIHIMLSSPAVRSQLLVHAGPDGMLDKADEIGRGMGIAVYQLPFWHYTTPLLAKAGAARARRWLFLATYIVDRARRPAGK